MSCFCCKMLHKHQWFFCTFVFSEHSRARECSLCKLCLVAPSVVAFERLAKWLVRYACIVAPIPNLLLFFFGCEEISIWLCFIHPYLKGGQVNFGIAFNEHSKSKWIHTPQERISMHLHKLLLLLPFEMIIFFFIHLAFGLSAESGEPCSMQFAFLFPLCMNCGFLFVDYFCCYLHVWRFFYMYFTEIAHSIYVYFVFKSNEADNQCFFLSFYVCVCVFFLCGSEKENVLLL